MPFSIKKYFGLKETFLLLIGVIIIAVVFSYIDINTTGVILQNTEIYILFLFILIRVTGYAVANYRWKIFVDRLARVNFSTLFPIFMSGHILDNLVPGPGFGAEPVKAYYLSKLIKKDLGSCFATALMDNIVLSFVLFGYFLFSIGYMYLFIEITAIRIAVAILLIIFALFGLAAIYFYFRREHRLTVFDKLLRYIYNLRIFEFLRKKYGSFEIFKGIIKSGISNLKSALKKFWHNKKLIRRSLIISFIWITLGYLGNYVLFLGYGVNISFYAVIAVLTLSDIIGYYSVLPAGTGIIEGSRIAMFAFIGVSPEIAAAVTIIDRVVFYISAYGLGYVALGYVNWKYAK